MNKSNFKANTIKIYRTKTVIVLFVLFSAHFSFQCHTGAALPQDVLSPLPDWLSKGAGSYYLNMDKMVKSKKYTRLQAAEIQNQMRDCLFAKEENPNKHKIFLNSCYRNARKQVMEEKKIESGFKIVPLKKEEFYAVFDLDETLLSQWYKSGQNGSNYIDLPTKLSDWFFWKDTVWESPKYVSFTPGWEKYLKSIAVLANCKGLIVFTAKEDEAAKEIYAFMKKSSLIGSHLKGLFTRNYLVRNKKVIKPSKDLRIIDPKLKHVVIVDDNPTRLFQSYNVRVFPKYNADAYLTAKNKKLQTAKDINIISYFESLLAQVSFEIIDSANYARINKTTFSSAYFPFSQRGAEVLRSVEKKLPVGYISAVEFIRKNHSLFEPKFYSKNKKKK